jgi:menaquinone-dependent protoporphyrinogen oxidase
MARTILVAYTTNAGSTTEVANAIAETLGQDDTQVDVRQVKDVGDLGGYDAVVVGGPMIMGWHRKALRFVKEHNQALSQMPVAYFFTAMHLTETKDPVPGAVPIYLDPSLATPPAREGRLSFKERQGTVARYLAPALKAAPEVKPVSAGFFAGKLDYDRLRFFQTLFVKLVIGGESEDLRNWEAISAWAAELQPLLQRP